MLLICDSGWGKKSPPPLPDLSPRLPLPLIRKTIHGPATPTFLVGLSTGASICSNPSCCHSRAAINPIIIFLTSRADGANWQICILDRVKPKQRRAELRSPFHFNAKRLGCLRSGRSFPLPFPPLLGMEACSGWWGVSSVPVFLSTASHVSWSGSMSSPARCAACEAAEEPPHCDKTRGSRFFLQRGNHVLICDQEANEQMLHYPPPTCVSVSALPGLQRHMDEEMKGLWMPWVWRGADTMLWTESDVHVWVNRNVNEWM